MKSKVLKTLVCSLLCISMLLSTLVMGNFARASTKSELQSELNAIEQKIKANEAKLKAISADKAKQSEYLKTLEDQISSTQKKMSNLQKQIDVVQKEIDEVQVSIDTLNEHISDITDSITQTQNNIINLEKSIIESYDMLAKRLRAAYMTGEESNLKILLGAKNLASFLTRLEMMRRVSENDTQMINDFKASIESFKEAQTVLEEQKVELEGKRNELNEKNSVLSSRKKELTAKQKQYEAASDDYESKYSQIKTYVEKLDKDSSAYKEYIASLENEYDKAEEELNRVIAEAQRTTTTRAHRPGETVGSNNEGGNMSNTTVMAPSVGKGEFMWPVGNISCYISSPFGNRVHPITGRYKFHGGIDITGPGIGGKNVYASKAGTVITTIISNSGYGNYVIVDHHDGYVTVYAHLRTITCSKGQYVAKGTCIGKVGTTGSSTGNHLHFEIRYNGTRQNPSNYVHK